MKKKIIKKEHYNFLNTFCLVRKFHSSIKYN